MQLLPWCNPLDIAARIDDAYMVLLHSSAGTGYSGRYSYLAHDVAELVEGEAFSDLASTLHVNIDPSIFSRWFGYFGYGLKHCTESLPPDRPGPLHWPSLVMMRFHCIYCFDHKEQRVTYWSSNNRPPITPAHVRLLSNAPTVEGLSSNMTHEEYLQHAAHIIEKVHAGELYQANLTRKFMGRFGGAFDAFALFERMCHFTPAPYSAFLRMHNRSMLSSSPELFMRIDGHGHIETRPIKGTAPRGGTPQEDQRLRDTLLHSIKDRAENLMITDLMRNDLAKISKLGSVQVQSLFEVTTHATIQHLSSTITAQKQPHVSALNAVSALFPPGSMTGAPKISAIKLCTALERDARGPYSGALGWLEGDMCELSVIIRTLLIEDDRFEFQVGGGIIADSSPKQELEEIYSKSNGLLSTLGIDPSRVRAL